MLQHEDITKVQELKGKFDKVWISFRIFTGTSKYSGL